MENYFSQAGQDKYIVNVLKKKTNGFFVEIGSNDAICGNNTYLLENKYKWTGIMVEFCGNFLEGYKTHRPKSVHVIDDATQIDYMNLFETSNAPLSIDYLQIDLDEGNGSTLKTLQKFDETGGIFDNYKFATITFEHDIYWSNAFNTREVSREIFTRRGYYRVFADVNIEDVHPFEDWYVHSDLVDMNYIQNLQEQNQKNYKEWNGIHTINYASIQY